VRSTPCPRDRKRPAIRPPDSESGADVRLRGLTWRPARRRTAVLSDLDLRIPAGQRVLLTGPSGSGKSTLLRAIAGLLLTASHGELSGEVLVDGDPIERADDRPALLLQDPLAGIVAETVGRDVAFGPENHAVPREAIWRRVRDALTGTAFPYREGHPTSALSGGESQRLALAGSLALDARVLLLDEPTSMLDAVAASTVHRSVRRLAEQRGSTVVIVEHRLEPWLDFVDRLVVLGRGGDVVADGEPRVVLATERESLARLGVWVPGLSAPDLTDVPGALVGPWHEGPAELVRAEQVWLERRHPLARRMPPTQALRGVDAAVHSGRALAVTGASGAGKSSLVAVLAGLRAPTSGDVQSSPPLATRRGRRPHRWRSRDLAGRLAWVPQSPEHGIVGRTVRDEVVVAARACGRDESLARRRAEGILEALGLSALSGVSPYHLSGGEQRRLMVAAALTTGPYGVLLDEPTVGQDRLTWGAVVGAVSAARSAGAGVAFAGHDVLAVDVLADDVMTLAEGVAVP
jgi:energy-coupling factor transporter ATP-binding protein EcfA2